MWKKIKLKKLWVIDEEALCWDKNNFSSLKDHREFQIKNRELIEFGVTEIDLINRKINKKFTFLIKPQHGEVSDYCTELTGISQKMLDEEGISLARMVKLLKKLGSENMLTAGWGAFDHNFLKEECKNKKVSFPFPDNYINLSDIFAIQNQISKGIGLEKALKFYNLDFEGDPHRAIWDSYNTARLYLHILNLAK